MPHCLPPAPPCRSRQTFRANRDIRARTYRPRGRARRATASARPGTARDFRCEQMTRGGEIASRVAAGSRFRCFVADVIMDLSIHVAARHGWTRALFDLPPLQAARAHFAPRWGGSVARPSRFYRREGRLRTQFRSVKVGRFCCPALALLSRRGAAPDPILLCKGGEVLLPGPPRAAGIPSVARWAQPRFSLVTSGR
jgi:hypothetical protein